MQTLEVYPFALEISEDSVFSSFIQNIKPEEKSDVFLKVCSFKSAYSDFDLHAFPSLLNILVYLNL